MTRWRPIETELGVLWGRDCVYLDAVTLGDRLSKVTLIGEIGGRGDPAVDYPYELVFSGVLGLRVLELDSWFEQPESRVAGPCVFYESIESTWRDQLGGKVTPSHRHITLVTYDDAFDVVCLNFALKLGSPRARPSEPLDLT